MSHRIHKLVGPMLRTIDPKTGQKRTPATVAEVEGVLINERGWLKAPRPVVDEWLNEAKRRNGLKGTSEIAGQVFRADQELRRRPRQTRPTWHEKRQRLNWLQRAARRITRLFS